jgi:hypothetical protein
VIDFLERLALAVAPVVATELTRHVLEQRAKPATVQPSEPAPSFAAYVRRHR